MRPLEQHQRGGGFSLSGLVKSLFLLLTGLCIGLFLSAWTGAKVVARYREQCTPAAITDIRIDSAECVAEGSAPLDCVERARREYCE